MDFPYGEGLIFGLAFLVGSKKRSTRRLFLLLLLAWLTGKAAELAFPAVGSWHWHYGRLLVMLVFGVWAWRRAEKVGWSLLIVVSVLCAETLFVVNLPGVIPFEMVFFMFLPILLAWLTTRSFWGAAAVLSLAFLLNQVFRRFAYEGILGYVEFPESFVWHAGVSFLLLWSGLRGGWLGGGAREKERLARNCEAVEEQEIS